MPEVFKIYITEEIAGHIHCSLVPSPNFHVTIISPESGSGQHGLKMQH